MNLIQKIKHMVAVLIIQIFALIILYRVCARTVIQIISVKNLREHGRNSILN